MKKNKLCKTSFDEKKQALNKKTSFAMCKKRALKNKNEL